MKNFEFLFWAYNCFFLILGAFLVSLLLRLVRAEKELRRIEGSLRNPR